VMGYEDYRPLAARHRVPIIVTGFEPVDLLQGVWLAVRQLEAGRTEVENQYARAVRPEGNRRARQLLDDVFEPVDRAWRGIGVIPQSGYRLRDAFAGYDAERRFESAGVTTKESPLCIAGLVLRGVKKPHDCPAFGTSCTPERPLGAPMVSSEGACAAYYHYRNYSSVR
jgi:hydrogenase expression/formation protein HypD